MNISLSEGAVIGTALAFPNTIPAIIESVSPDMFENPKNAMILEAVFELSLRGDAVDTTAIVERLVQTGKLDEIGGAGYILSMIESAEEETYAWHLRNVRQQAQGRETAKALERGIRQIRGGSDIVEVRSEVLNRLSEIEEITGERVHDDLKAIGAALLNKIELGDRGNQWPWEAMNDSIGLMVPGRVCAVTGFSGSGKSVFMRNLASAALLEKDYSVAYFALEEDGPDVLGLMCCAVGDVDYMRFGGGRALQDWEVERMVAAFDSLGGERFTLNQRPMWTPQQILAKIRSYAEQGKADLVIIDHAHLIDYSGKTAQDIEIEVGRFTERLTAYCKEYGIYAVVAFQPRKPGDSGDIYRPVSPDEIRGTSRIWNIVWNSISPYRPRVKVNPLNGEQFEDEHGLPIIVSARDISMRPSDADWVPRSVSSFYYVRLGKARIGGDSGRDIIFRFNDRSAKITERRTLASLA